MSYIQASTGSRNRVVGHKTVFYCSEAGKSLSHNFCVTLCLNLKNLWWPFLVKCTSVLPILASPCPNMPINTLANGKASNIRNSFHTAFDIIVFYWCMFPGTSTISKFEKFHYFLLILHFDDQHIGCIDFKTGMIPLSQFIKKALPNQHYTC